MHAYIGHNDEIFRYEVEEVEKEKYSILLYLEDGTDDRKRELAGKVLFQAYTIDEYIQKMNEVKDNPSVFSQEDATAFDEMAKRIRKKEVAYEIALLKVEDDFRGKGLGKELIYLSVMEMFMMEGNATSFINALPFDPSSPVETSDLIAFYEKCGYKQMHQSIDKFALMSLENLLDVTRSPSIISHDDVEVFRARERNAKKREENSVLKDEKPRLMPQ